MGWSYFTLEEFLCVRIMSGFRFGKKLVLEFLGLDNENVSASHYFYYLSHDVFSVRKFFGKICNQIKIC